MKKTPDIRAVFRSEEEDPRLNPPPEYRRRRQSILHSLRGLGVILVCLASRGYAADAPAMPDAWVEAKPACVFPLASDGLPDNVNLLTNSMAGGLTHLADPSPRPDRIAVAERNETYPALDRLSIDLSDSTVDDQHKPPKVNWHFQPVAGVSADRFDVFARPLKIQQAKINYELTADAAKIDLAEDRARRPILMLTGTRHGHLDATVSRADVQTLCLAAARHWAAKYHFHIENLALYFRTPTDRSLVAIADVTLGGELYGTLHFTGRFNIDDDLTATASDLGCEGSGPGGLMVEGMVTAGLLFYDGKTKLLVVFPFDRMRLTDVRIHADRELRVSADFGDK